MSHYEETIGKFLDKLNVDCIREIRYCGKHYGNEHCVCGQRIRHCYVFTNKHNGKKCVVGKECLNYVAEYLGWK